MFMQTLEATSDHFFLIVSHRYFGCLSRSEEHSFVTYRKVFVKISKTCDDWENE